ncbi:MAG: ribonuclease E/G [Pseudomonadota bacterium]
MKGALIALDRLPDGRAIAARLIDGRLDDLLVDPPEALGPAQPGAIFRGRVARPMKGQGGVVVDLGGGLTGFLRDAKGIAPGAELLVQVTTAAEAGKAAPVTRRLLFKSRYAILTPGRPGANISRQIKNQEERARLAALVPPEGEDGLILRSAAEGVEEDAIRADIDAMRALMEQTAAPGPGLRLPAPDAHEMAWRDWTDLEPEVVDRPGAFDELDLWTELEALRTSRIALGVAAWMSVEPTRALVAVDINTGADTSAAAGLKADIAALRALPAALRVRGLGGQIVIDPAPFPKKERPVLEQVLRAAFRACPVETSFAGWTPLGHIELQRKRERRPITEVLWP